MADRTLRTEESREATKRTVTWTRPNSIPDPEPKPGVEYRCIRTSTLGKADMTNVSSKFREGGEPVKAEDHPELKVLTDVDSKFKGNVEVGGLLLCKNSTENMDARREHYKEKNDQQLASVDNNYLRESDSRMPVLRPEKVTRTS